MAYYANIACTELTYMYNWEFPTQPYAITIQSDYNDQIEKAFDLPPDWKAMIDDTHWDRNTQLPAIGPVNAQDWQWLIVRKAKITTRIMWRIRNKQLWVKSPPNTPEEFTFEYLTKNWAVDGTTGTPTDAMVQNSDYHVFPWQLPFLYTRAKWFENEGYDPTGALADFQKAFLYETGVDKAATALNLVPGTGYPYINAVKNVPDTGYGSA